MVHHQQRGIVFGNAPVLHRLIHCRWLFFVNGYDDDATAAHLEPASAASDGTGVLPGQTKVPGRFLSPLDVTGLHGVWAHIPAAPEIRHLGLPFLPRFRFIGIRSDYRFATDPEAYPATLVPKLPRAQLSLSNKCCYPTDRKGLIATTRAAMVIQ